MDTIQIISLVLVGVLIVIFILLKASTAKNKKNNITMEAGKEGHLKKAEGKEEAQQTKTVEAEKEKAEVANIYHVSQNKDEKSARYKEWRVRKQGSQKTIKYFQTQKEAIEFAEQLAEKAEGSIVIHKKTGEMRKQSY